MTYLNEKRSGSYINKIESTTIFTKIKKLNDKHFINDKVKKRSSMQTYMIKKT